MTTTAKRATLSIDDPLPDDSDGFAGLLLPDTIPEVAPATSNNRPDESAEILAHLLCTIPRTVAIIGRPGSGRTTLLAEVTALAQRTQQPLSLYAFSSITGDPEKDLQHTIADVLRNDSSAHDSSGIDVIVIDDLDILACIGTPHPQIALLDGLCPSRTHRGLRFLVSINDQRLNRLAELHPEFADSLTRIAIPPLPERRLVQVVTDSALELADRSGLQLADDVIRRAVSPAGPSEGLTHPGLAISRIDTAITRARLQPTGVVGRQHLGLPDPSPDAPGTATDLGRRLREGVRGQDAAITALARRLTPALAGLKLRPERPHGIFLFVGPTGVGKTELAKQLARVLYGSSDSLIRLDMSEYADDRDARMKLIGGSRIWKDSSTEGLLTTKVLESPHSIILLDEFEKSASEIWPLFLQVFDEGRLTDGWGRTASFADSIIIMTSNLGAREGSTRAPGFATKEGFRADRQLDTVTRSLPPEFLNRVTETVSFTPLTPAALRELSDLELSRLADRLAAAGWEITYDAEVIDWLARTDYLPAYGARHLQRNIERWVFPQLSEAPSRRLRLGIIDDRVAVVGAGGCAA